MKNRIFTVVAAIFLFAACAFAQDPPKPPAQPKAGDGQGTQSDVQVQSNGQNRGQGRSQNNMVFSNGGGGMSIGTITAIQGNTITIKDKDGKAVTVNTSGDTRYRIGRDDASAKDFKVGSSVIVRGEAAGENKISAQFIIGVTAEQMAQMQQMAGQMGTGGGVVTMGGPGGGQMGNMQEQLGKTLVIGQIKSIDELKITVEMTGQKTIVMEVDENTSFKKENQSVTLADFKAGDRIMARGVLNSAGTFVAKDMSIGGNFMFRSNSNSPDKPKEKL